MSDTLIGTFAVSVQENRILLPSHGLLSGDQVLFVLQDPSTCALPTPLNENDYYFVAEERGNDFRVAATASSPVINLENRGVGDNQVWKQVGNPDLYERQMSSTVTHLIGDYHFAVIKLVN